ncbi:C1q-like domain-containing protein [Flavobacterium sp. U410]
MKTTSTHYCKYCINKLVLVGWLFSFITGWSQVGVNTTSPNAMLDVNGDVIIQNVPDASPSTTDKILVLNNTNNRVEAIKLPKSFVKGVGGSGFAILSLTLLSGWNKISFPSLEFDENADFSLTNQSFTAPMDGIYYITVYIKMTSLINLSNFGVGIFKDSSGTIQLIADETYDSLSVTILGIGVTSPPTRSTQTLVKLNQGDKVYFGTKSSNLTILNNAEAQFSIHQVK